MDEAVGVHHFDGGRKRERVSPFAAADAAEFQHKDRADALSACEEAVAHGLKQLLLRAFLVGKAALQIRFHGFAVGFRSHFVVIHLLHTPFPPVRHRRPSSV